jgi:hypothetical protein
MPYQFTPEEVKSFSDALQVVIDNPYDALTIVDRGRNLGVGRYAAVPHVDVRTHMLIPVYGKGVQQGLQWYSHVGERDDFDQPISDTIIDGKTCHGPWATMTPESWHIFTGTRGCLGLGKGQMYRLRPDRKWIKTEAGLLDNGSK